jgi:hypothetical protein
MTLVGALGRYTRQPSRAHDGERCALCSAELTEPHPHVVELARRSLACACRACAVLFSDPSPSGARYRTVPDRVLVDPEFSLTDGEWATLQIPVGLAFLVRRADGWTACYPSPGGALESPLLPEALHPLAARSRLVERVEPDVEALLFRRGVGRLRDGGASCYLAPLSACYELVGLVRRHWKGFDGGDTAWHAIDAFFDALRARSRPIAATPPAAGGSR